MTAILKATKRQTYPLINPDSEATLGTPNTAVLTIISDDKVVAAICEDKTATIGGGETRSAASRNRTSPTSWAAMIWFEARAAMTSSPVARVTIGFMVEKTMTS